MRKLQAASVPLGAALALSALPAHADDRAIAQQVFQEARDLLAAGKVAEACPKFAAAAQLSPTAGVRLNLSDCYARLGKVASAWAKADEALTIAERAGDAAAASVARERMATLKPKLSYLTIVVDGTSADGLEIRLDGEKIPQPVWGASLPTDPGEHAVAANAPGRASWSAKVTLAGEASRATVSVPRLEEERGAATNVAPSATPGAIEATGPASAAPSSDAAREPSGFPQATIGLVTAGVGVVGLGVGTVFGLSAMSKKSGYEEHQGPDGRCLDRECVTLSQDALSAAKLSTIGFVAGGVLVATGAVLWLTAPSSKGGQGQSVALVPSAGPSGVGASLSGSF